MGYVTVAYGVDLERLAAVRGSNDAALLSHVEERFSDRLGQGAEMNRSLDLREALRQIVAGRLSDNSPRAAAQYIYACELLCEYFGRSLDGREHIKFLEDLAWDTALLESRTPLGLPAAGPLPATGYLTADEVQLEYARFGNYDSDDDEPELADAREEFVWWLKQCADDRLALVTFCY